MTEGYSALPLLPPVVPLEVESEVGVDEELELQHIWLAYWTSYGGEACGHRLEENRVVEGWAPAASIAPAT